MYILVEGKKEKSYPISKKIKNIAKNVRYSRFFCNEPGFLDREERRTLSDDGISPSDKNPDGTMERLLAEVVQNCRSFELATFFDPVHLNSNGLMLVFWLRTV